MTRIEINKRTYPSRGRALGAARRMVTLHDNHVFVGEGTHVHVEWTLDNVVVEETAGGWRWFVVV